MKSIIKIVSLLLLFFSLSFGAKIGDINMPDTLQNNLVLNGAGIRSKFFFDLYVGGLYLKNKNSDASYIINANEPMAIKLHIISSLITSEKMINATLEGFENSTHENMQPIKAQIDKFIAVFKDKIKDGDIYDFIYTPNDGVKIYKNSKLMADIKNLEFKKALFGIWLCDKPAQGSLKEKMLGK